MEEYNLGPNGAMLYCIEFLEANFDWLVERLDEVLAEEGGMDMWCLIRRVKQSYGRTMIV